MANFIKIIQASLPTLADVFTILASSIAIYLFLFKRQAISSAFKVLANYSLQITFSELNKKIDEINDLNIGEQTDMAEIVNLLNDIVGQIRGNKILRKQCSEILARIEIAVGNTKRLNEQRKRSLVSELRESLRHISIENFDDLIGG